MQARKCYIQLDRIDTKTELDSRLLCHADNFLADILLIAINVLGSDKLLEPNAFNITPLGIIKEKVEIEKDDTFTKILLHLETSKNI